MRQLFTWTLSSVSDFAENFAFMKSRLVSFFYRNNGTFNSFCVFKRLQLEVFYFIASDTDIKELTTSKILNRKVHNISDFGRTLLKRVNLWNKLFTTCHTLERSFWSVRDFKKKFLQGGRLRKKWFATRQFLKYNFYTVSDFAENFAFKELRLFSFSTVKMAELPDFVFLKRLVFQLIIFFQSNTDIKT